MGSDSEKMAQLFGSTISIHAPRVGSDPASHSLISCHFISIHAPRVGSDRRPRKRNARPENFNPRSPRGERRYRRKIFDIPHVISIHAPRVGSDVRHSRRASRLRDFNPRSPRGERLRARGIHFFVVISIHAPRVGSDDSFNRPFFAIKEFQSTLPAWGATVSCRTFKCVLNDFNPRSPRGERRLFASYSSGHLNFNPRSPRGERHFVTGVFTGDWISIHAPRVGSDCSF